MHCTIWHRRFGRVIIEKIPCCDVSSVSLLISSSGATPIRSLRELQIQPVILLFFEQILETDYLLSQNETLLQIELQAKLLNYSLGSNKSNINQ